MLEQIDIAVGFSVVMLLLSLLVTIIVQAIAAVLDLRGRNLVWGITKVLHQIDPEFEQKAGRDWNEAKSTVGKKIAEAVSKHSSIAHSWLGRATAVRPEELMKILQDLAERPPAELEREALEKLRAWAGNTVLNPAALAAANAILAKVETSLPAHSADVKRVIDQVVGAGGGLQEGVNQWFDTMMDRSSDKFAQFTRWVTVVIAVLLAFGLVIDSDDIFQQISKSSEIRGKLAGIADQTLKKADEVVSKGNRGTAALTDLRDKHKNESAVAEKLKNIPDKSETCRDAQHWLDGQSPSSDLSAELAKICQQQTADALVGQDAAFNTLRASLDNTGIRIMRAKFPENMSPCSLWAFYIGQYSNGRQLLGVLVTALLLSLGAPFWYNALRQLASLKPAIARKIDEGQSPATDAAKKS